MNGEIAISVKNLSKSYRMYPSPKERLKEMLHPLKKKYHRDFWALRDVSFEVKKGETVGIIGRNGSGKSTLLQVLCGILQPTRGNVKTNGRVSALLELGAGFSPQFTGRENVYLNGAIMGFSREEMEKRFQAIADFADIGDFIEQPVRTYSSGMYVRLAFACAINVDPDILIVDEALAVGDMHFVQKCLRKFEEFRERGITTILVSHSMNSIKKNCDKALLLDHGEVIDRGEPKEVIDVYNALFFEQVAPGVKGGKQLSGKEMASRRVSGKSQRYGSKQARIMEVSLMNNKGLRTESVDTLEQTVIKIQANFYEDLADILVGISIRNRIGLDIYMTNTEWKGVDIPLVKKDSSLEISFAQKMNIVPGEYAATVSVSQNTPEGIKRLDWISDCLSFNVLGSEKVSGICNLDSKVSVEVQSVGASG